MIVTMLVMVQLCVRVRGEKEGASHHRIWGEKVEVEEEEEEEEEEPCCMLTLSLSLSLSLSPSLPPSLPSQTWIHCSSGSGHIFSTTSSSSLSSSSLLPPSPSQQSV